MYELSLLSKSDRVIVLYFYYSSYYKKIVYQLLLCTNFTLLQIQCNAEVCSFYL